MVQTAKYFANQLCDSGKIIGEDTEYTENIQFIDIPVPEIDSVQKRSNFRCGGGPRQDLASGPYFQNAQSGH